MKFPSLAAARIENDTFSIKNMCKSLDMNFIPIKKHEMEIW